MPGELNGKYALVGGASQGIGAAIAGRFAEAGARVILMSRSADKLERVRKGLNEPDRHVIFPFDLENYERIPETLAGILRSTGPVEIVINNSGGPAAGQLTSADV